MSTKAAVLVVAVSVKPTDLAPNTTATEALLAIVNIDTFLTEILSLRPFVIVPIGT